MSKLIHRELCVPANTSYLAQVRQAVTEVLGKEMFSSVKANLVALAVDEAVANIMEHAYENLPAAARVNKDVQIILDATPERLLVIIRDQGIAFDPRNAPDVDMREHVKKGNTGGLGIFLMRRIMDEIHYTYKQGVHNELKMIKYAESSRKEGAAVKK
jgi:serine/threonine-protein kinase RsbW